MDSRGGARGGRGGFGGMSARGRGGRGGFGESRGGFGGSRGGARGGRGGFGEMGARGRGGRGGFGESRGGFGGSRGGFGESRGGFGGRGGFGEARPARGAFRGGRGGGGDRGERDDSRKRKENPSDEPEANKKIKKIKEEKEKEELVLMVRNLPFDKDQKEAIESDMQKIAGQEKVFIPLKPNGNTKGYAFVTFADPAMALAAKIQYNEKELFGRPINVDFADKNSQEEQLQKNNRKRHTHSYADKEKPTIKTEIKVESEDENGGNSDAGETKSINIKEEAGDDDVATRKIKKEIKTEDGAVAPKLKKKAEIKKEDPKEEKKRKQQALKREKNIRLQMNKELEVCVKKRDVKFAEKVFTQFSVKGLPPDAYTYTHMINICARYGNVDRATYFFEDMLANGVAPNVVTYTSYIKGLVMWGRMDDAVKVLRSMDDHKVVPNFRTYNTVLRGCLKDGNVDLAIELFNDAKKQNEIQLDISCYAYVMMCNCYALRTQDAWDIAKSIKTMATTPAVAKAYASLAVAEAVLGHLELAKRALQKAEAALEQITGKSNDTKATEENDNEEVDMEGDQDEDGEDGDEGDSEGEDDQAIQVDSDSDDNSIAINRKGKIPSLEEQQRVEKEYQASEQYLGKSRRGPTKDENVSSYELFTLAQKEEITAMCTAVKEFLEKGIVTPYAKIKSMEESSKMVILPPKNEVFPVKLRYADMFKSMTAPNSNRPRDTKLEICSGLGDWVVFQAKRCPNVNWISAEIRHERVFQIWSKGVLAGLDNLFAVEADARLLVTKYIPPESLREVFINFPEPPSNENKLLHLLTPEFLKQINGILQRHGKLIIVTDNFHLAHQLETTFKSLSNIYKSTSGVHPYSTQLPPWYGSSYFDKFWTQGQRHQRFYFEYKKTW